MNKAQQILAHTLWIMDNQTTEFRDLNSRKAAFNAASKDYLRKAGKLIKTLKGKGVDLSLNTAASTEADEA